MPIIINRFLFFNRRGRLMHLFFYNHVSPSGFWCFRIWIVVNLWFLRSSFDSLLGREGKMNIEHRTPNYEVGKRFDQSHGVHPGAMLHISKFGVRCSIFGVLFKFYSVSAPDFALFPSEG